MEKFRIYGSLVKSYNRRTSTKEFKLELGEYTITNEMVESKSFGRVEDYIPKEVNCFMVNKNGNKMCWVTPFNIQIFDGYSKEDLFDLEYKLDWLGVGVQQLCLF